MGLFQIIDIELLRQTKRAGCVARFLPAISEAKKEGQCHESHRKESSYPHTYLQKSSNNHRISKFSQAPPLINCGVFVTILGEGLIVGALFNSSFVWDAGWGFGGSGKSYREEGIHFAENGADIWFRQAT